MDTKISNDRLAWYKGLSLTGMAGAGGGFVGFVLASLLTPSSFDTSFTAPQGAFMRVMSDALLFMFCGASMALAILATDNVVSLRGRWTRDLPTGLWFFSAGSFGAGMVASIFYLFFQFTRSLPWAIAGATIGTCIGLLRKDKVQAARGALGGALGGGLSGFVVDGMMMFSYTEQALAMGTFIGVMITGALIGVFMQLVQSALKTAWLIGTSTGPYEGKQYLLNTDRVTVGASELHDISLYRNSELRVPEGALEKSGNTWRWKGEPAEINGVLQTDAPLESGDSIQLGRTLFRFRTKTGAEASPASFAAAAPGAVAPVAPPAAPPPPLPTQTGPPPQVPQPAAMPTPASRPQVGAKGGWELIGPAGSIALPPNPGRATVGRADDNDIVLADSGVSSRHALIETYPYAIKVTDLQSTNGISVNGVRMPAGAPAILHDGDVLQVGEQVFQVKRTA